MTSPTLPVATATGSPNHGAAIHRDAPTSSHFSAGECTVLHDPAELARLATAD